MSYFTAPFLPSHCTDLSTGWRSWSHSDDECTLLCEETSFGDVSLLSITLSVHTVSTSTPCLRFQSQGGSVEFEVHTCGTMKASLPRGVSTGVCLVTVERTGEVVFLYPQLFTAGCTYETRSCIWLSRGRRL